MARRLHQFALVVPLLGVAAVLAFFSPRLALVFFAATVGGTLVRMLVQALSALPIGTDILYAGTRDAPVARRLPRSMSNRARLVAAGFALVAVAGLAFSAFTLGGCGAARLVSPTSTATTMYTTTPNPPPPPPPPPAEVPVRFVARITYVAAGAWNVQEVLQLSPQALRDASAATTTPLGTVNSHTALENLLTRAGWVAGATIGRTLQFSRTSTRPARLHRWPLVQTLEINLHSAVPDVAHRLLFGGKGSLVVMFAPKRMVRGTFPKLQARTDMFNGNERIVVPLGPDEDLPQTELRIRAANGLGQNAVVAQVLDALSTGWAKWLVGAVGVVRGLLWKRIKTRLAGWWRRRPPQPPVTPLPPTPPKPRRRRRKGNAGQAP
jgi:hypothetical protein